MNSVQLQDTKSTEKSIVFLYTNNEQFIKENKKIIQFTIASKRIILSKKFNQEGKSLEY